MKHRLCRRLFGVAMATVFMANLAGCGQQGMKTEAGQQESETAASGPTEDKEDVAETGGGIIGNGAIQYDTGVPVNNGEEITINFWVQTEWQQYYEKWTEEYSEIHPNVKWNISVAGWGDHFTKLPIALSSGTGPDLFHMHNQYSSALVPNMEPYPQDIFPHEALMQDFRGIEEHLIDGELYFMDYGIITPALYYNKTMWQEAGLTDADLPKTWDQLRKVAGELAKKDESGKIVRAGVNFNAPLYAELAEIMLLQKGKFNFTEDGQRNFEDPDYKENLQWLADIYNVDQSGSVNFGDAIESFGNQQAAIIYHWGFAASVLDASYPELNYGILPVPSFDGEVPPAYCRNNGESTPGVSKTAPEENRAVAFDFIKYVFANDAYQEQVCSDMVLVPTKYSVAESEKLKENPAINVVMGYIDRTIWPGALPAIYESDLWTYICEEILTNGKSVDEAVKNAAPIINKDLKDSGFVSVENMYKYASELSYE